MSDFIKSNYQYFVTYHGDLLAYLVQHYTFVYVLAVQWNVFGLGN